MKTVRSLVIATAVVVALVASSGVASAKGPFSNNSQPGYPRFYTASNFAMNYFGLGKKAPMPTFQAAPWYNYWPYDAHFLTPAPVTGAFYGPPTPGNFPVNPYFPGPGYGGFGPIPGGPPPRP